MSDAAIFLCSRTANMALPWAAAGVECWCVDTQHSIRREHVQGNIRFVWGDVRSWRPPEGLNILFVAAFPPCTQDAVSGARDFETKGGMMLRDSLELFESARMAAAWSGAPYMVEHPATCLASIPHIGPPDFKFHPNDYGDPYTKETWLWTGNGFRMPPIVKPGDMFDAPTWVEPSEGSKMHRLAPSADRANIRAATPMGFATAAFFANAPSWRLLTHPDAPCQVRPNFAHDGARSCSACTGFWPEGADVACGRGRGRIGHLVSTNMVEP
jgi:hypothetical protein